MKTRRRKETRGKQTYMQWVDTDKRQEIENKAHRKLKVNKAKHTRQKKTGKVAK